MLRQWPAIPFDEAVVDDMHSQAGFAKYLNDGKHYNNFLELFKREMQQKGLEAVLQEYLFARDERAEDMLHRTYAGFMHPLIHIGFGLEFHQPALIAEGLAQAAVHDKWMGPFFVGTEKAIAESPNGESKSIVELLQECRDTPSLRAAAITAPASSNNRIRDGILIEAPAEMIKIVSQYRVKPAELKQKAAEMTNAGAYLTGAAQRPSKKVKMDFQYIHTINTSIFFPAILKSEWLSDQDKCRLLEWKVWTDVVLYASRGQPELRIDEITSYKPKEPGNPENPWKGLFRRICAVRDDGHAPKLIRSFAHGQRQCKPYEHLEGFVIKGDMWLQLAHMAVDSVEPQDESRWVVNTGWDEAWDEIPERPQARL